MAHIRTEIELPLPAASVDELVKALVIRDELHGSTFEVEVEGSGQEFDVDLMMTDELDDENGVYLALVEVEVDGDVDEETLGAFLTEIIDETAAQAAALVEQQREIAVYERKEIVFRAVESGRERWDLVIPDWLAPEDAVVPYGFRSFLAASGTAYPDDARLEAAGRILVIPMKGKIHFIEVPLPEESSCTSSEAES